MKNKHYLRLKKWVERDKIQRVLPWVNFGILGFFMIILFTMDTNDAVLSRILGVSTKSISQPMTAEVEEPILATSTPTPYISPTPTIVQKIYVAPTIDSDPPVHCKISPTCGGGTTPLKQSECSNSTCCQIGDKWIFYKDKNQCTQDQNKLYGSTNFQQPQSAPQTLPSVQTVTCILSYGTYQLTQSSCDSLKSTDKPYVPSNNTQTIVAPDPAIQQQNNFDLNQQCKDNATQVYNSSLQQANAQFGGGSSAGDAIRQIAKSQYDSSVSTCDQQYPVN